MPGLIEVVAACGTMVHVSQAFDQSVTTQPSRADWIVSAGVSGAVFAVAAAAVFAVLFGIVIVVDGSSSFGEGSGETVYTVLFSSGMALLVGGVTAAPVGAALGVLNGWLARVVPPHLRRLAVALVGGIVGVVSSVLLPDPLTNTLDFTFFGAALGAFAAVTSGVHLRREQRKWAHLQINKSAD